MKKLKKPNIRTVNHRDGGMSFYSEGGETDPPALYPNPNIEFKKAANNFVKSQEARKKAEELAKAEAAKKASSPERFTQKPVLKPTKLASDNARVVDKQIRPEFTPEEMEYFKDNSIPKELYHHTKKQLDTWKVGDIQDAADIEQRRKDVAKQAEVDRNKGLFTQAVAEDISNGYRLLDKDNFIDSYLNPFQWVMHPAGNLAGNFAVDAGPIDPRKVAMDAGLLGLGIFGAGDFVKPLSKIARPLIDQGIKSTGQLINKTGQKYLPNAYNYNPWEFKPKETNWYRQVGKEAIDDALKTKLIREAGEEVSPRMLKEFEEQLVRMQGSEMEAMLASRRPASPFFVKGKLFYPMSRKPIVTKSGNISKNPTGKGSADYLIETSLPNESFQPAYVKSMNLGVPTEIGQTAILKPNPTLRELKNFNIYKKDWLKGYKQIETPYGGNTFQSKINWGLGLGLGLGAKAISNQYAEGGEYELTNEEIQELKSQGYEIELL